MEIANRLLILPELISNETLTNGDYMLINFGTHHTIGADYYLAHPGWRKFKSIVYKYTHGLIDSNEIAIHRFESENWNKTILRK